MYIPTKEYPMIINESLVTYFKESMGDKFQKRLDNGTIVIVPDISKETCCSLYCEDEVKDLFEKYGEDETKNKVSRKEILIYEYDEVCEYLDRESKERMSYLDSLSKNELRQEFYKTFEIEPDDETLKKWVIDQNKLAEFDIFSDITEHSVLYDLLIDPKLIIKSLLHKGWEKAKNGTI